MSVNLNLPSNAEKVEDRDSLGGGALPSKIYRGKVVMAYLDQNANGTYMVIITFETAEGRRITQTTYISNKSGSFTFNRDGKDYPLPGYSQMDAFFSLATGKGLGEQLREDKTIKVWDNAQSKEVPAVKSVFMDVINKPMACGVLHVSEERTTQASGYEDGTGEYRNYNELNKWFDYDTALTLVEKKAGETEPKFASDWKKKWEGEVDTRHAPNSGKAAGTTAGAPNAGGAKPSTTTESLF